MCRLHGRVGYPFVAAVIVVCVCVVGCAHLARQESGGQVPAQPELVFVYLHGFGGVKEKPRFVANMKEFLETVDYACEVRNYEWDSVDIHVLKAGANWLKAERQADAEAVRFKRDVMDRLEEENTPYVIIGFSVGSRVVLRAIEQSGGDLRMLRGVYFLGSAMTRDTTIATKYLPQGMKIVNYHSPSRDSVHRIAFNFMADIPAGGQVGFEDESAFDNYAVSCAHAYKGVGPHIDYSQLAYAIGYVALFKERVFVQGDTAYNIPTRVSGGDVWWNKILRMDYTSNEQAGTLEIEQLNMNLDYFRAVFISGSGERRRLARGNNLHAILDELGAVPKLYWRLGESGASGDGECVCLCGVRGLLP